MRILFPLLSLSGVLALAAGCSSSSLTLKDAVDTGSSGDTGGSQAPVDADGDGYFSDEDCDDSDADVNPGGDEQASGTADGVDDDCSGYEDDVEVCESDADYDSIQGAIDSVPDGFLLRICPGTYRENLSLERRSLGLLGMEGAEQTIIDAQSKGPAMSLLRSDAVEVEGLSFVQGVSDTFGGGILCQRSTLTLTDSIVSNNKATNGAGLGGDRCTLESQGSTFSENIATNMGGGIYLVGASSTLLENTIADNEAYEGGGITIYEGTATLRSNSIVSNTATTVDEEAWGPGGGGGGAWLYGDLEIIDNLFEGNTSQYHGGGFYIASSSPEIRGNRVVENLSWEDGGGGYTNYCGGTVAENSFEGNEAYDDAGGFRVYVGSMTIEGNSFSGNSAADDAGGMKLSHSSNTIRENTFEENSAGDAGGGLELDNETSSVTDCVFYNNTATRGAGLHSWRNEGSLTIERSTFEGNRAGNCGGAIQMDNNPYQVLLHQVIAVENYSSVDGGAICTDIHYQDDDLTVTEEARFRVTNSLFLDNVAADDGGAIYLKSGTMQVINVTMHGNEAGDDGGGIAMKAESSGTLNNVIISRSGEEGIYIEESYDSDEIPSEGLIVTYSDVWGSTDEEYQGMADPTGSNGNISTDPRFVSVAQGDFGLKSSSPCVDSGNPNLTDTDGSRSDMGATGGPGGL